MSTDPPESRQPKILIVDDDASVLLMVERYLERKGMDVVATSSAIGVTSLIRRHNPDAVVLDVSMPAMDGTSLAKLIRRDRRMAPIPIIFYTAFDADRVAGVMQVLPDSHHIPKSEGIINLHECLERILARRPQKPGG